MIAILMGHRVTEWNCSSFTSSSVHWTSCCKRHCVHVSNNVNKPFFFHTGLPANFIFFFIINVKILGIRVDIRRLSSTSICVWLKSKGFNTKTALVLILRDRRHCYNLHLRSNKWNETKVTTCACAHTTYDIQKASDKWIHEPATARSKLSVANKTGFYLFIVREHSWIAAPSFARNGAIISDRPVKLGHAVVVASSIPVKQMLRTGTRHRELLVQTCARHECTQSRFVEQSDVSGTCRTGQTNEFIASKQTPRSISATSGFQ